MLRESNEITNCFRLQVIECQVNQLANRVALLTDAVEWISHQMDPIQQSRQMIEKIHFRVNQQEAADPTDCRSH